jgi:hypothetical protein
MPAQLSNALIVNEFQKFSGFSFTVSGFPTHRGIFSKD